QAFRTLCHAILSHEPPAGEKFIDAPPVDPAAIDPGYRLYTEEDLSRKLIYVEASRGCPYGCEFCLSSIKPDSGPAVRYFPPEPFLAEMDRLIQRGVRTFKFLDRTFNLDTLRARRIMEFFLERLSPSQCVHFEMVPSRFPPELVETLARFPPGTLRLEIGFQTFNPRTSRLINRPGSPAEELETLETLRRETSAIIHAGLIAGLPGEDLASFGAGFDRLWRALTPSDLSPATRAGAPVTAAEIQPGILKLLPGAPIARHTDTCGMVYAPEPPYEVRETAALPAADLDRIKNFARFWELIVNRGAFPALGPALFPAGEPVFRRFMELSGRLFSRFGRNWGIDRADLRKSLEEEARSEDYGGRGRPAGHAKRVNGNR
ncbi:MAG: radical SAM protein, partial [Treponema sp.]|nr:radical SAM protein [Treponema sp.]